MHITLRPGEKLYLNGAVLRTDRKVSIELMNDAIFMLEAHVMSVEKAATPLRQLYFVVQTMLMDPHDSATARKLFAESIKRMRTVYADEHILDSLLHVNKLVRDARYFDALKVLRGCFGHDDALMAVEALALAS